MELLMKIAYVILLVTALMTFWPLVVFLVVALLGFLVYSSWKTKKLMNETQQNGNPHMNKGDIIEAEYTEKEIEHE